MRIQHNISALNAHRQLGVNNEAVSKNLEKLSSGYRINRAGDDAAGLAISEKMRGQIRGLDQAKSNAQDGISLIQTAEGGLNETHSILQRMRELAVQSSNGTYKDEVDRENINKEVESLKSEIDRIATSTHFNKINLLDGSMSTAGKANGPDFTKALSTITTTRPVRPGEGPMTSGTKASLTFDFSANGGNPTAGETLTVAGKTITFGGGAGEAAVGADFDATMTNVLNALNGSAANKTVDGAVGTWAYASDTNSLSWTADTAEAVTLSGASTAAATFAAAGNQATSIASAGVTVTPVAVGGGGAAVGTLTYDFSTAKGTGDNFAAGEEISIAGQTYKFGAGPGEIAIGADFKASMDNLATQLNTDAGTVAGEAGTWAYADGTGELTFTTTSATADITNWNGADAAVTYTGAPNTSTVTGAVGVTTAVNGVAPAPDPNAGKATLDVTINTAFQEDEQLEIAGEKFIFKDTTAADYNAADYGDFTVIDLSTEDTVAEQTTALIAALNAAGTGTYTAAAVAGTTDQFTVQADDAGRAGTFEDVKVYNRAGNDNNITATNTAGRDLESFAVRNATVSFSIDPKNLSAGNTITMAGETMKLYGSQEEIDALGTQAEKDAAILLAADDTSTTLANKIVDKLNNVFNSDVAFNNVTAQDGVITFEARTSDVTAANLQTQVGVAVAKGTSKTGGAPITFQIGANGSADQRVNLSVEDMSSQGIGVANVSVSTQGDANNAIETIDRAINIVSGTRADLGALQNRLEHTVANLGTTSENLTAAESRIRDVDMAKEMMEMTKNNILTQAAQAMLAQANTQPQGVLQLLR